MPTVPTVEDRLRPFFDSKDFYRYLYKICLLCLTTGRDSPVNNIEDAINDVFYKAWRARDTFRPPAITASDQEWRSAFKKWISQIARHHCIDIQRRRQTINAEQSFDASYPFPDLTENLDLADCLKKLAEADLPAHEALIYQEMEQWKQEEVATLLGMTLRQVQTSVARGKRKMRKCLGEDSDA